MKLRDRTILNYLKLLQREHHISQGSFSVLLQYIASHQLAVVYDEALNFLVACKRQHVFPNFIESRFSNLPYQRNQRVQRGISNLKTALLEAATADRRRRRSQCILTIVRTKPELQSQLNPTTWRSISSLNQRICASLRYQEKCRLENKLERLCERAQPHRQPSFMKMNAVPPKRHTVIGTNEVDNDMAAVLNLGPSFAISRKVTNMTIDEALCGVHHFAHRLRTRIQRGHTVLDRESTLLCSMPFQSRRIRLPDATPAVDSKIAGLELAIQRIYQNEASQTYHSNLTKDEREGFRKLLRLKHKLRYMVGDKCGSFVVMPQSLDKEVVNNMLSDSTTYAETTSAAFRRACEKVRETIRSVVKPKLGSNVARSLLDLHPLVPTFYCLVKTHKLPPSVAHSHLSANEIKARPIVASCSGPSDRLSWLLVQLLSPLLQYVGAHIVNVEAFLSSLHECQVPSSAAYASFDVVSLYTNVDNRSAVEAVSSLFQQHQGLISNMGFSTDDVTNMINTVLSCNVFRFENKFFEQRRGLSMGNRIAPLLAIIFLDRIERMSLTSGILLYKRYIDDVFVVGATEMEVEATLGRLNASDPQVSFTVERPDEEGYLPYLNTAVRITQGRKEHVWYKKAASANILVHARSAHPQFVKANVVRNLIRTKDKLCSRADPEVERTISRILEENGYVANRATVWFPHSTPDGIPLILPYVGDSPARAVNEVVKRSGLPIRLVFRPPPTLKHLLASTSIYENKCPGENCQYCTEGKKICMLRGTVYLIRCEGCGEKYVGETMRPLRRRLDEHRRALTNPASYPSESFSRHRTLRHTNDSAPKFNVVVLHRNMTRTLERKIMEAIEIKRYGPEINNKEELKEVLRFIA
ncbi:hypothetical protein Y032_0053g2410 [Ancylostoma ceylanicum]|uniref:Helix-turn-helix domain-containing protein n=1 Tax=Ancylostoma ceylanicum TaxID=53326 RepID=A0A016U7U4_9BILA|nr:hypothetical protein Y032_0053g2410 [Ancylostoma ceylanicum]